MTLENIAELKEALKASETMLKVWHERSEQSYVDKIVTEQEKVIGEASTKIFDAQSNQSKSAKMIVVQEKRIKVAKKKLIAAKHAAEIEKLQRLAASAKKTEMEIAKLQAARKAPPG